MPLKIEREEDRQLPRWVYALMASKADPNDAELFNDSPKLRFERKVEAENFHRQRQARLKEIDERFGTTSRLTGLEWKRPRQTKFTSEELDKIIPTRRISYIIKKTIMVTIIATGVIIATSGTAGIIAAVCAEIKLGGNFDNAWTLFQESPSTYVERVYNTLKSSDDGS